MKIYLDDKRTPDMSGYDPREWTVVRTVVQFIELIAYGHNIEAISFDHDLGEDAQGKLLETGYDAIKQWVYFFEPDPSLVEVRVHSANPVGAENIRAYWRSWCKHWAEEL